MSTSRPASTAASAGPKTERAELFDVRMQRWLPDLRAAVADLYSPEDAAATEQRLLQAAAAGDAARPAELRRLDLERTLEPDWFQSPRMLGYAAYAERFGGTLAGMRERVPYLRELGVTYLHLMPLLLPRPGENDGGYAVADYRTVRPDLGTMSDLAGLADELRHAGVSLVLDLVLNHVAREHQWARAARAGDERYRRYFHVFPDRSGPDAFEATLPQVFPEFAPGNFTWDEDLRGWVWTTFHDFQWDVDWSNPDVLVEYAGIVFELANAGVEVLRLDAIAFVWKRLGTDCQNQPEVHSVAQALRALTRIVCPAVLLKAEAIVAPDHLVHYLGRGRHHGKVSDLAYHNTLMVQIWSMLACRDVRLAVRTLQRLPPIPPTTAWICYLRCHDDIGWAIDDADAAAAGWSGPAHRAFLSDYYVGLFPGSDARGLVFQANPSTGDRRVSGTTASLAGLDVAGEEGAGRPPVDLVVARILLAHAIVLGWGGLPVLWTGDELAISNDADWRTEPGHEDDNRWAHRPRLTGADLERRHDRGSATAQVFAGLRDLIAARASLPMLHAAVPSQVLDPIDPGVLLVLRSHPQGDLLELFNVTDSWRTVPAARLAELGFGAAQDALGGPAMTEDPDGLIWLSPYRAAWLVLPL